VVNVGSAFFSTLKVVLIVVLLIIEIIMLANPMVMNMMIASDKIPPVKVLY
jgi:hypothetical protein